MEIAHSTSGFDVRIVLVRTVTATVETYENPNDPTKRCRCWGMASIAIALVFPVAFYGITRAESAGILGPASSWGRMAVGVALTVSSCLAVILGIVSMAREALNPLAIIGLVVGCVELLLAI
jgi:hypothetical protein